MTQLSRRTTLMGLGALSALLPGVAATAPRAYVLRPDSATIRFAFTLSGMQQTGTAPLARADILVDPTDLEASEADVSADLTQARTGLIFATQALKSQGVLDTDAHPLARFRSTRVTLGTDGRISDGATIDGELTLRGITRPVRFEANLYRPPETAPDDLRRLSVHLRGAINRVDYGATGFADLVAPEVALDIRAEIDATG